MTKVCTQCKTEKEKSEFYNDIHQKDGKRPICKECTKKARTKARDKPKETSNTNEVQNNEANPKSYDTKTFVDQDFVIQTDYPEFPLEEKFVKGKHYSTFISASRNSGKTTWIKSHWKFFKSRFDFIVFFTHSLNASIYEFLDENDRMFVFDDFNPMILEELETLQKISSNAFHIAIFFDDYSDLKSTKHSDALLQLWIRGRNKNTSVFFSTQSPMFIDSNARANVDFLVLLKCRTPAMKKRIVEQFLYDEVTVPPYVKTKSQKMQYYYAWLDANTKDYKVIVVDFLNNDQVYQMTPEPISK